MAYKMGVVAVGGGGEERGEKVFSCTSPLTRPTCTNKEMPPSQCSRGVSNGSTLMFFPRKLNECCVDGHLI